MTGTQYIQYGTEYLLLRSFAAAVQAVPVGTAIRLGRAVGRFSRVVLARRTRLACENLALAFGDAMPPPERRRLTRSLLALLGEALVESLLAPAESSGRTVTVEGWEHLERALSLGRGAIIVPPHLGMWELAATELGRRLGHAAAVYRPMRNPYIDRFLLRTRQQTGLDLLSSRNGLRKVLGYLRSGGAVLMLLDQNAGRAGVPATFFGRTASTHAAPALFALRLGCPVLPGYILTRPGYRCHHMVVQEAFPLIRSGDVQKDILANTQQYNDYIEAVVRAHPEQWFGWLHQRWKQPRWYSNAILPSAEGEPGPGDASDAAAGAVGQTVAAAGPALPGTTVTPPTAMATPGATPRRTP